MKKICVMIVTILVMLFSLTGCVEEDVTHIEAQPSSTEDPIKVSYLAEFYDNYGDMWLSVEGTSFDISPNKVKEYYYDSSGSWISGWTTSSIMSVSIDGKNIESCGSTIIFADSSLIKHEINIPTDVVLSQGDKASINSDSDLKYSDAWTLNYWWIYERQEHTDVGNKFVIIQSQNGDPICMYSGDEVFWEVSRNLPKTTEVNIDGKIIYIHRANFAIIDASIFGEG